MNDLIKKLDMNLSLGDEFSYSCLPLAIIDAIYSIRQGYKSTKKVVGRYCTYYNIGEYIWDKNKKVHTVSQLIKNIEDCDVESFAKDILESENKTAGRNPMLKSKAVLKWAEKLRDNGIETFEDLNKVDKCSLKKQLMSVHGQGEAATSYFFMLCGDEDTCKPDVHLLNFLSELQGRDVKEKEAQALLEQLVNELKADYPHMTVRLLDYIIWRNCQCR